MEQAAITSATNRNDPDWNTISRDILCPLCDYNLRGLVEPRCPECGHRSTWAELLDPSTQKHPWLFEHQDRRRARGFVQTLFRSQFPQTFWKEVHPTHRPRVGRLIVYWCIVSCLLLAEIGCPYLTQIGNYYVGMHQRRQQYSQFLQTRKGGFPSPKFQPMTPPVADAQAAATFPSPMPWIVWKNIESQMPYLYRIAGHLCFVLLLWPLLTIASLMIFRQTLQQVHIRHVHVLRCAIYTMDAAVFWGWPFALAMAWCLDPLTYTGRGHVFFTPFVLVVLVAMAAMFTYRLSCAYHYYMRFPAPVWTCVACQVIVMLALLAIMPWVIMF